MAHMRTLQPVKTNRAVTNPKIAIRSLPAGGFFDFLVKIGIMEGLHITICCRQGVEETNGMDPMFIALVGHGCGHGNGIGK